MLLNSSPLDEKLTEPLGTHRATEPRITLDRIKLFCRIRKSVSEIVTSLNIPIASFAGDKNFK